MASGFFGGGGSGGGYITSVSPPLSVSGGVLSIACSTTTTSGVTELATQAETYVGSPLNGGSGCPLVPSITNLLLRQQLTGTALFTQAHGTAPNTRGTDAIDIQTGRNNTNQVAGGYRSVCVGYQCNAGTNSIAVGPGAVASGSLSVAIGYFPQSLGSQSVSIGTICQGRSDNTLAVGSNLCFATYASSIAVGVCVNQTGRTINMATGAQAGSGGNVANGINSTAVGIYCQAQTNLSQVFGLASFTKTNAGGVAHGILCNASGATLTRTTGAITGTITAAVSGRSSTTVGIYSTALGHQSVAMGNTNFSSAYSSVAMGLLCNTSGATVNNATGAITGTIIGSAAGIGSVSIGILARASGVNACAIGSAYGSAAPTTATTAGATAMGFFCTASNGTRNVAVGSNTAATGIAAAVAFGSNCTASGESSVAIGRNCTASAKHSSAVGDSCVSNALYGSTVGYSCTATSGSTRSVAMGMFSFSSSTSVASVAIGSLLNQTGLTLNQATGAVGGSFSAVATTGIASTTVGIYSNAQTSNSVCVGNACFTKTGATGVSLGVLCNASGQTLDGSTGAIGGTIVPAVSGLNSVTIGINTNSAAANNVTVGLNSFGRSNATAAVTVGTLCNSQTATLTWSTGAISGTAVVASNAGIASTTMGIYSQARSTNSVAIGNACFTLSGNASQSIGSLNNQSGATLTRTTGAITGTIVAAASGRNSSAIGIYNTAAGAQSAAIGNTCFSSAYSSFAAGILCNASGQTINSATGAITGTIGAAASGINSTAIGVNCAAQGLRSVAMGFYATAVSSDSIAIHGATTASNQIVIGGGTISITNFVLGNGVNNATPLASTFFSTGGLGANIVGAQLNFASGASTGNAVPSRTHIQGTALGGGSGGTAQTQVDRVIINATKTGLTSGGATSLFEVALPTIKMGGGQVILTIEATDNTDVQVVSATVAWACVNKGGVFTTTTSIINQVSAVSAGTLTLTTAAFLNGTNKVTFQITPTEAIVSATVFRVTYMIISNCPQAITVL